MQSRQKLKTELTLNQEMVSLVDTLKGVAVSEFQSLERRKERFEKFMDAFDGFFKLMDFSQVEHSFVKEKGGLSLLMITSNEGFMGGLNTRVIQEALSHPHADEAKLIVVGERGANYLKGMGYEYKFFPGIVSEERYESALQLKNYILEQSRSEKLGELVLFYPHPVSFFVQKVEEVAMLPCYNLFKGYIPEKKTEKEKQGWMSFIDNLQDEIIVESSLVDIVEHLVEEWITQKLFEVFEDSKLAELSARAVHLEESYQLLIDHGKKLRYQYFRSHHEFIDRGLRDMFSAQVVKRKKKR